MSRRALFIDRDGTLIYPEHYPSRPQQIRLYENLGEDLCRLQLLGFSLVVITNQSGLAQGYFTPADLERMHLHLRNELDRLGVELAGLYYCPHHPQGVIAELTTICECRKPQPGMLLQAAKELNIDLSHSWFLGDILDDVEAGRRAGCSTILVDLGTESWPEEPLRRPDFVACNTQHALRIVQAVEGTLADVDMNYLPLSWQQMTPTVRRTV